MAAVYAALALAAGTLLPFQAGINAQLARWVGGPVRASLVSFLVGTLALLAVALIAERARSTQGLSNAPWWIWIGGLLGAVYVAASVVMAPKLGAATFVVLIVAGQSLAGVVVDQFGWVGFPEHHVSPWRLVGIGLLGAGVALVRFT